MTSSSSSQVLRFGLVPPQGVTAHFTVLSPNAVTRYISLMVKLTQAHKQSHWHLLILGHSVALAVFGPAVKRRQCSYHYLCVHLF